MPFALRNIEDSQKFHLKSFVLQSNRFVIWFISFMIYGVFMRKCHRCLQQHILVSQCYRPKTTTFKCKYILFSVYLHVNYLNVLKIFFLILLIYQGFNNSLNIAASIFEVTDVVICTMHVNMVFFSSIRNSVLNAVPTSLVTYKKSKVSSPIPLPGIKRKTSNSSSPEWTFNITLSNLIRYCLNLIKCTVWHF